MSNTAYVISKQNVEGEFVAVASKSKRATAIEFAQALKQDEKVATQVHTAKGTLVAEFKARKPQKKTKPYTRVVELPEGFTVPEGKRVAYTRMRKNAAILHDWEDQYWVYDLTGGDILGTFGTTRQCGRFLADSVVIDAETGRAVVVA